MATLIPILLLAVFVLVVLWLNELRKYHSPLSETDTLILSVLDQIMNWTHDGSSMASGFLDGKEVTLYVCPFASVGTSIMSDGNIHQSTHLVVRERGIQILKQVALDRDRANMLALRNLANSSETPESNS
jgi:hypothetical protein